MKLVDDSQIGAKTVSIYCYLCLKREEYLMISGLLCLECDRKMFAKTRQAVATTGNKTCKEQVISYEDE